MAIFKAESKKEGAFVIMCSVFFIIWGVFCFIDKEIDFRNFKDLMTIGSSVI